LDPVKKGVKTFLFSVFLNIPKFEEEVTVYFLTLAKNICKITCQKEPRLTAKDIHTTVTVRSSRGVRNSYVILFTADFSAEYIKIERIEAFLYLEGQYFLSKSEKNMPFL